MNATAAKTSKPAQAQPQPANGAKPDVAENPESGAYLLNELLQGRKTSYVPLAEKQEVSLSVALVKQHLCVRTRKGYTPEDSDCLKYIMMCRQRGLNPWVGDCYLLGYDQEIDGQDVPKFSMVVAIQALFKRAEISRTADGQPAFDGIESGVVVLQTAIESDDGKPSQEVVERQGDLVLPGERLLGGWSKVYRKDRSRPFYQRLKLETYQRPTKIWRTDAAGMICKDAEAAALRQAFPSDVGGLFLAEEIEAFATASEDMKKKPANPQGSVDLDVLRGAGKPVETREPAPGGASGESQDSEGQDEQTGEEPSQQINEPEATGSPESEGGVVTEGDQLEQWLADIGMAKTGGALDELAEEAESAPHAIKARIFKAIGDKRAELKAAKPKANSGQQQPLPGA